MGRKSITFIYPQMVMGGAEKALICLLKKLNLEKYDVNLLLLKSGGELEQEIPDGIRVFYCKAESLGENLRKGKLIKVFYGLMIRTCIRCAASYEKKSWFTSLVYLIPPELSNSDCVICYTHFNFLSISLAARCKAKHRILWVHSIFRENLDKKLYIHMLSKYDKVFCVSKTVQKEFEKIFPMYSDKSEVFYNLIDAEQIRTMANYKIEENIKHPALCTVARLSEEKGQQFAPEVVKKFLEAGKDVHWYLIGDGPMREKIMELIYRYDVKDNVVLVGNKENPFPYMKQCDIYLQPSEYEGYGLTILEAKIIGCSIVVTDFSAVEEQISDGKNGFIVKRNADSIFQGVLELLESPEKQESFRIELTKEDYSFSGEVEKLYRCL